MINETRRSRLILYVALGLFALFALAPYYWVIRTSFLTDFAAINPETNYLPALKNLTITAYEQIWERYNFVTFFSNSIIVSVTATVISLFFSIPGAYAFARLDFPGRKVLFYTAVFTIMFPWIVITIPVYEVFFVLGLINTLTGVIIALSIFVLPQTIWLLQGFFRQGIPENIEEAALIDGHSELGAFLRIVLPLSAPAVGAAALFAFLTAWNNFLWVFVLTSDEEVRTATVALHYILGSDVLRQWNILMASVVLLVAPPVVFYGLSQRYVGEGLGGM
ncbi:carbohydrate ABC transporter permease [Halopelagius longus]|uniref:Carbohydrate ABC transporter permease n=1 Tax=Halopelagius longus TaxID=1236180 RepID=A0A1H1FFS7_9EURY|nr:carbohydrate ABC transporter permease [Halopelagius longus]RDI70124.1 carbohydrate ABC transporter permease [Halopelagius longus]SDQ99737.1 multiple sugar transport system permease protein [Halopelagius longus]